MLRGEGHACWRVESALRDAGIDYDIVRNPAFRRSRREIVARTGQRRVPVVEFADGSMYRAESREMAAEIRAGRLFEHSASGSAS
jgi:uncharacterized protein YbjT (DUF2867 family)